ncbi:MAG: response regulator [Verrucomicrobia bacterium]|nr:response regulator [Verrucomicrobiota bacterium]
MKSVLIIEPDLAFGMSCVRALVVAGFQATHVTGAGKGLSTLNQSRVDAVVLSLRPRDNRAIQFLQEARSAPRTRTIPIVAFARENVDELMAQARSKGATECLLLSRTGTEELVSAVNKILSHEAKDPPAPAQRQEPANKPAPSIAPSMPEPPVKLADAPREPVRPPTPSPLPPKRESPSRKTDSIQILQELSRALFGAQDKSTQEGLLRELHQAAQGYSVESAAMQSSPPIAALFGAWLALLKELSENPRSLGSSNVRTIFQAVNCLDWLLSDDSLLSGQAESEFKILAVDDDPAIRNLVKLALSSARLSPDSAKDGNEALELCRRNLYELFILDVKMPGLSGFELCQKLRAFPAYRKTPVIFVTGEDNFGSRVRSAGSGGDDFIGKPFLMKELAVKALIHLLAHRLGQRDKTP